MAPVTSHMRLPVAILAINSFMITLSFIVVVLRLWSRTFKRITLQSSDYVIILAWLLTFGFIVASNFAVTKGGVGQTPEIVTVPELVFSLKMFVIFGTVSIPAVTASRVSAIFFFISIFPNRIFRLAAYGIMAINIGQALAYIIGTFLQCTPFAYQWNKTIPGGHCINTSPYYSSQAIIGVILDIMVVILPLPMLWGLKMKLQKKISLSLLFGLGFLICIISIVRLAKNEDSKLIASNFPGYAGQVLILSAFEANLSVINACLPLMQPVFTKLSTKIHSVLSSFSTTLADSSGSNSRSRQNKPKAIVSSTRFGGLSENAKFNRLHDHLYPQSFDVATKMTSGTHTSSDMEGSPSVADLEMGELRHEEQQS